MNTAKTQDTTRRIIQTLLVLGITQNIGWGSVGLLAVVAGAIAADLRLSVPAVFAGNTVFYITMGLASPLLARPLARWGARWVMLAGSALAVPGFVLLSMASGAVGYYLSWALLGLAGAATLTTTSHVLVNEVAGAASRRAIGALMLVTGLSGSIFWPVSALVSDHLGWRGLCLVLAALIGLVSIPLYGLALPRRTPPAPKSSATEPARPITRPVPKSIFALITGAIVLNAIVTFGLNALFIELLKAEGLPPGQAITFASMLGLLQVGARLLDFVGARRWDAITTGILATAGVMVAFALLLLGQGTPLLIGAFVVIYGLSAGSLAVTRAIMPLTFYDGADFARASMRIALPLNVLTALAAPLFASLLTGPGPTALLATTMGFCGLALVLLLLLARQRRHALAPAAG